MARYDISPAELREAIEAAKSGSNRSELLSIIKANLANELGSEVGLQAVYAQLDAAETPALQKLYDNKAWVRMAYLIQQKRQSK